MSSGDRPHVRAPSEGTSPSQTGFRAASERGEGETDGTGRSGEYRAVRAPTVAAGIPADDRLTPTEPLLTAGKPLPALQRPPATETRPRALSNPALERPFASLPPSPKRATDPRATTDPRMATDQQRLGLEPARQRSEPPRQRSEPPRQRTDPQNSEPSPPSVRRPLSAGAQRKLGTCAIHRAALSPGGDCVLCRREADRHARARWSTVTLFIMVALAIVVGVVLAR
jgi:hypothetical protein